MMERLKSAIKTRSLCHNQFASRDKSRAEGLVPMSILRQEHLMERKLSVQVSLDHIHPALQSRL